MITVATTVPAPIDFVWKCFTQPEHITQWNQADKSWHCPQSVVDLQVGGRFCTTMAAKDGTTAFDFTGKYTQVEPPTTLAYTLDDGRTVRVTFTDTAAGVVVTEDFETEQVHSLEQQRVGWQAILDSFARYVVESELI
jgi:uncharacterized protein YndB with AHSA1/START domain